MAPYLITICCFLLFLACGELKSVQVRTRRMVGGNDTVENQFPYMVDLLSYGTHKCGGTIIDAEWVLTAAHCIRPSHWFDPKVHMTVSVGKLKTVRFGHGGGYKIKEAIRHPGHKYTRTHTYNDVGLIQLSTPLNFSASVQSVKLGTVSNRNASVIGMGWGYISDDHDISDHLRYLYYQTLETDQCQTMHNEANNTIDEKTHICVYGGIGKSSCFGDSGGPLINAETGRLVGVNSGIEDCTGYYPVLYMKVSAYIDWIRNVTKLELPLD